MFFIFYIFLKQNSQNWSRSTACSLTEQSCVAQTMRMIELDFHNKTAETHHFLLSYRITDRFLSVSSHITCFTLDYNEKNASYQCHLFFCSRQEANDRWQHGGRNVIFHYISLFYYNFKSLDRRQNTSLVFSPSRLLVLQQPGIFLQTVCYKPMSFFCRGLNCFHTFKLKTNMLRPPCCCL